MASVGQGDGKPRSQDGAGGGMGWGEVGWGAVEEAWDWGRGDLVWEVGMWGTYLCGEGGPGGY